MKTEPIYTSVAYILLPDVKNRNKLIRRIHERGRMIDSSLLNKEGIGLYCDHNGVTVMTSDEIIPLFCANSYTDNVKKQMSIFEEIACMRADTDFEQLFVFDNGNFVECRMNSEYEMWGQNGTLGHTRTRATQNQIAEAIAQAYFIRAYKMRERQINETYRLDSLHTLRCIKRGDESCGDCYFNGREGCDKQYCNQNERTDKNDVIYKLIEDKGKHLVRDKYTITVGNTEDIGINSSELEYVDFYPTGLTGLQCMVDQEKNPELYEEIFKLCIGIANNIREIHRINKIAVTDMNDGQETI